MARCEAHIASLREEAPRAGLGAATGRFIEHIATLGERYGAHLFVCFDDSRVPPSTNMLEGFFGRAKRPLRRACGTGSTSNSIAQNLGGEYLAAFALLESSRGMLGDALVPRDALRFREERRRIASAEAPITRRRSLVRKFDQHVARLRAHRGLSAAPG